MALLPGSGPTLALAIESVVGALLGKDTPSGSQYVRMQTSAPDEASLVAAALAAIADIADSFEARATGIQIDGIRPIDQGYRLWGLVQIDPNQPPRAIPTPTMCRIERSSSGYVVAVLFAESDV